MRARLGLGLVLYPRFIRVDPRCSRANEERKDNSELTASKFVAYGFCSCHRVFVISKTKTFSGLTSITDFINATTKELPMSHFANELAIFHLQFTSNPNLARFAFDGPAFERAVIGRHGMCVD